MKACFTWLVLAASLANFVDARSTERLTVAPAGYIRSSSRDSSHKPRQQIVRKVVADEHTSRGLTVMRDPTNDTVAQATDATNPDAVAKTSSSAKFKVGDAVDVRWDDGAWYRGKVSGVTSWNTYKVDWFDGDTLGNTFTEAIQEDQLRFHTRFKVDEVVDARWEDGLWYPARIHSISSVNGTYQVDWIGDGEDSYTDGLTEDQVRPASSADDSFSFLPSAADLEMMFCVAFLLFCIYVGLSMLHQQRASLFSIPLPWNRDDGEAARQEPTNETDAHLEPGTGGAERRGDRLAVPDKATPAVPKAVPQSSSSASTRADKPEPLAPKPDAPKRRTGQPSQVLPSAPLAPTLPAAPAEPAVASDARKSSRRGRPDKSPQRAKSPVKQADGEGDDGAAGEQDADGGSKAMSSRASGVRDRPDRKKSTMNRSLKGTLKVESLAADMEEQKDWDGVSGFNAVRKEKKKTESSNLDLDWGDMEVDGGADDADLDALMMDEGDKKAGSSA